MKLLIVGSRSLSNIDIGKYIPKDVDIIISGGAKGIDTLAERYADKNGISKLILKPKYNLYGKGAPLKRNEEMITLADKVLVFWDGRSRGTKFTIDKANALGIEVEIITIE